MTKPKKGALLGQAFHIIGTPKKKGGRRPFYMVTGVQDNKLVMIDLSTNTPIEKCPEVFIDLD